MSSGCDGSGALPCPWGKAGCIQNQPGMGSPLTLALGAGWPRGTRRESSLGGVNGGAGQLAQLPPYPRQRLWLLPTHP